MQRSTRRRARPFMTSKFSEKCFKSMIRYVMQDRVRNRSNTAILGVNYGNSNMMKQTNDAAKQSAVSDVAAVDPGCAE